MSATEKRTLRNGGNREIPDMPTTVWKPKGDVLMRADLDWQGAFYDEYKASVLEEYNCYNEDDLIDFLNKGWGVPLSVIDVISNYVSELIGSTEFNC
jgi:hypothetical protein